jgi:hypothetical protein
MACLERDNGKLIVLTMPGRWWNPDSASSVVHSFSSDGTLLSSVEVQQPLGLARTTLLAPLSNGRFAALGTYELPFAGDSLRYQAALWPFSDDLEQGDVQWNGPLFRSTNLNSVCLSPQGEVVAIGWAKLSGGIVPTIGFTTHSWNQSGDPISNCLAYDGQPGWMQPYEIQALADGRSVVISNSAWSQQDGLSMNIVGTDQCSNEDAFGTPPVGNDPWQQPVHFEVYGSVVPLTTGQFVVSGTYFAPEGPKTAIQLIDQSGNLLQQRIMAPMGVNTVSGLFGHLDTLDGMLFHVQMEHSVYHASLDNGGQPDRVHVRRLDTSFVDISEFEIDGFVDQTTYVVLGIQASRNGGLYVFGEAIDQSTVPGTPQGWITYIDQQDLNLSVPGAHIDGRLSLYPNPGQMDLYIELPSTIDGRHLTIVDIGGRLVHSSTLSGDHGHINTGEWASGIYHLRILNDQGQTQAWSYWVRN